MHIYIYDSEINNNPKFLNTTAKIETRITDLGLNGKIVRLSMMTSLGETIANELKKGAKTITIVGTDDSFFAAVNKIALLAKQNTFNVKVPLGFIPIKESIIAPKLGIANYESACDVLSARRIMSFDLGKANNELFLTEAKIASEDTIIDIDQNYSIELLRPGYIKVLNLPVFTNPPNTNNIKGDDGVLELIIENTKGKGINKDRVINQSVFSFKNLVVLNKKKKLLLDGYKEISPPVEIKIANIKIDIIIGKDRQF